MTDATDFRLKVLHGFMVHEKSRSGYIQLIAFARLMPTLSVIAMIALTQLLPIPGTAKIVVALVCCAFALGVLLWVGNIEARFRKPVLKPFAATGSRFWNWELAETDIRTAKSY